MNIKIFIVIILLSSSVRAQEGWINQVAPSSVHELRDVLALNADTVFAVGDSCKIIKTIDGGKNWKLVYSNDSTRHYLYSVFFIDSLHGWAVGGYAYDWWEKPAILKTDDCGENWYEQTCDAIFPLYDVFFVNVDTGWIAGDSGTILKTVDGGNTWIGKESGTPYNSLTNIYFLSSTIGYIVGTDAGWGHVKYGVILKTSDGGETWTHQTSDKLYSTFFVDDKNGWIIGEPYKNYAPNIHSTLYFTNDGGDNWETIIINDYVLYSIFFIDVNKGWAVGNNVILYTTDGGLSWKEQDGGYSDIGNILHSVHFYNENIGWVVGTRGNSSIGTYGTILKTTNSGLSSVNNSEIHFPKHFKLLQNYPNPFNNSTTIYFYIPKSTSVKLSIYNILGKKVNTLINEQLTTGIHNVKFNSSDFSSGLYYYRLETPEFDETKKLTIQK